MKKFLSVVLMAVLLLGMVACGGGSKASTDPNAGLYTATTAEMMGIEIDADDAFDGGFTIELKDKGKCALNVAGKKANGKWTLDGTAFHVSGGGLKCDGTLSNGVIKLENVLDSGMALTFVREGGAPSGGDSSDETAAAAEAPKTAGTAPMARTANTLEEALGGSVQGGETPDEGSTDGGAPMVFDPVTFDGDWYGWATFNYYGGITQEFAQKDVWGKFRTSSNGVDYFEVFTDKAMSEKHDLLSMYIEKHDGYFSVLAGDEDAWIQDLYAAENGTSGEWTAFCYLDEGENLDVYEVDGAVIFYYDIKRDDNSGCIAVFQLRPVGVKWDRQNDLLPPSYDEYESGLA